MQVGPVEVVIGVYVLAWLVTLVICILKRKLIMAAISAVIGGGVIHTVGAIRLAKPDSYWARRFYDPAKLERARQRFPDGPDYVPPPVDELFR